MKKITKLVLIFYLISICWSWEVCLGAPSNPPDPYSKLTVMRINAHFHSNVSFTRNFQNISDFDHALTLSPEETAYRAEGLGIHLLFSDHCFKMTLNEWWKIQEVCHKYSKMGFAMLAGFEWTPFDQNHISVFNCQEYVAMADTGAEGIEIADNLDKFLNWLVTQPKDQVFAQFNHLGFRQRYFNFAKIANHPAKDYFCLIEIGSGPTGFYSHFSANEPEVIKAICQGFWLALAVGADNYGPPDNDMRQRHTAVWVDEDSQEGLVRAILARRTFASEDKNAVVKFWLRVKHQNESPKTFLMGEKVNFYSNDKLAFGIDISDPKSIKKIELIAIKKDQSVLIKTCENNSFSTLILNPFSSKDWPKIIAYYLKITQKDNDHIITTPIYTNCQQVTTELKRKIYFGINYQLPGGIKVSKDLQNLDNDFRPPASENKIRISRDRTFYSWILVINQPGNESLDLKTIIIYQDSKDVKIDKLNTTDSETYNAILKNKITFSGKFNENWREYHYKVEFYVNNELIGTKNCSIVP